MSTAQLLLELKNIYKRYEKNEVAHTVLSNVNLSIYTGDVLAIMGPSGSGKSTLMHLIGLLDQASEGHYYLENKLVDELTDDQAAAIRNKTIGFVFQQFFLLARLTALQNVMLPLRYGAPQTEAAMREQAQQLLAKVGMSEKAKYYPNELSGGQQQRVAIARALVTDPHLILADEPTGALDSHTGEEVMQLLLTLNRDENRTIIIVTHDQKIGQQCRRVVKIQDGKVSE